jgi:hypothetical protein
MFPVPVLRLSIPMTRSILVSVAVASVLLSTSGCKRDGDQPANGGATSSLLDNATPEAREALAIQVDYTLTDENFARWEVAQRNLDRLPTSAFPAQRGAARGNVIDRAVARLESSPKARTTIEATGLSVRDFVLQTIALAQATEAIQNRLPTGGSIVPPENFRFVERHRDRIRRAQLAARNASRVRSGDTAADSGQLIEADTAVEAEAGIVESFDPAANPSPVPPEIQPPRSDTSRSGEDRLRQERPRDSTRDSASGDRSG